MSTMTQSKSADSSYPTTLSEQTSPFDNEKGIVAPAAQPEGLPTGLRLFLIMLGLNLAVFIVALDQTIISPAIPVISNQFKSTADVVWYGSAYFMTSTALLPLYSRIYRIDLKWTFLSCILIFEVGSIICAAAQNSKTFIVGRAIAGVGVAGGYIGVMTIIAASVTLEKKAMYAGIVGAVYGIGAVTGPLVGGAFTTKATWRWCFWINLPIGGITLATVFLFFKPPKRVAAEKTSKLNYLFKLDLTGTVLVLAGIVCYLLALQDGGTKKSWDSAQEIALLTGAALIAVVFFINEWLMGEDALIPLRILRQRTIAAGSAYNFLIGGAYFSIITFLPIYFQSTGSSSIRSGVQMLPLICGVIFSVTLTGIFAPVVGYTNPFLIGAAVLATIGTGLFQLLTPTSSQALWVGISFLAGLGFGSGFQFSFIASQAVKTFNQLELEIGGGITLFAQTLGGCLIVGVAQAIFQNWFHDLLVSAEGFDGRAVAAQGETAFRSLVPAQYLDQAVGWAVDSIKKAFIPPVACMGLAFFVAFAFQWNSIKGQQIAAAA